MYIYTKIAQLEIVVLFLFIAPFLNVIYLIYNSLQTLLT